MIIKGYIVWRMESIQPLKVCAYNTITIEYMNAYWVSNVLTSYLVRGALFSDKPKISSKMLIETLSSVRLEEVSNDPV